MDAHLSRKPNLRSGEGHAYEIPQCTRGSHGFGAQVLWFPAMWVYEAVVTNYHYRAA